VWLQLVYGMIGPHGRGPVHFFTSINPSIAVLYRQPATSALITTSGIRAYSADGPRRSPYLVQSVLPG
jgi:hypothetical protein